MAINLTKSKRASRERLAMCMQKFSGAYDKLPREKSREMVFRWWGFCERTAALHYLNSETKDSAANNFPHLVEAFVRLNPEYFAE